MTINVIKDVMVIIYYYYYLINVFNNISLINLDWTFSFNWRYF